ncbi:MarR family transcriptional regulator [Microbacterium sp.]|uniref:MarR family winged helix-turn-helix transcriptional regulator n=1 Tax=Microbacterium sp. TaxID=51671 RepID=UPI00281181A9|nr:MarR family transcriptional regulator [Microbacterium sp.]
MQRAEVIPSIVLSAHALARIAAQDAGSEAPAAQWRVLSLLEHRTGMRIGELARAARTTQPGMTRLIGDLERAGLVRRGTDAADSRATLVSLTEHGLESLTAWRAEFRDTLAPRFSDLTDRDWEALETAARLLATHATEKETGEDE